MKVDVARLVGAVHREVVTREFRGLPARAIVAGRLYNTDPDDLWDALTNAERIARWFAPVSGDLRLAGRYQIEGNASGEILECDPPRRLLLSWEYAETVSWVEVSLESRAPESTMLHLEHFARVPEDDSFWDEYGPGAGGVGWEEAFWGLELHLDASNVSSEAAEAWLLTDAGKAYIQMCSDAWGRAAHTAGADAEAARLAAERTAAFYTGEAQA